ncbi:hypothetical protein P691DRAFT_22078 [Macrolepiota fuliginosa MF-IS2]|uniref:Uncharacterized protein n=1 Tax=Macrolepiota fuliginosa MF-IS2 TaxID=1400762 RepID=A0A9P5XMJ0_9AGAR|nr:hypothetical protein P691DRAFT_22078 [Macrolepiota fuliginosa MF-IS2]
MTAHEVPAEVWGKIFDVCCQDGGQTGRSLALASRYFHAVSKSSQYISITLTGKRAIAKFAELLATNHECRRVKYLFMSTFEPEPNMLEYIRKGLYQAHLPPPLVTHDAKLDPTEHHQITADMYRILEFIAPTVRILHVVIGFYREEIFFPMEFPVLEELTIQGPFHDHYDCNDDFCDTLYPSIPSLRRLYLTEVFTCVNDRTYLALRHYAPYLTHLRIQCADGYIESSRTFLRQLLPSSTSSSEVDKDRGQEHGCGYQEDEERAHSRKEFPETLQSILLHPGPTQPRWRCGTMYMMRYMALRELEKCAKEDTRIVLFKESPWVWPYSRAHDYAEGQRQWLDRIAGGEGCWEVQ